MKVGDNKRLKSIAQQASNLVPSAKWIAKDFDDGDWFAYEVEPVFDTEWRWWLPSGVSGYAYICTTEVLPNEPVIAYEISKLLTNEQN